MPEETPRFRFGLTINWRKVGRRFDQQLGPVPQTHHMTVIATDLIAATATAYATLNIDVADRERRSKEGDYSYWAPTVFVEQIAQLSSGSDHE